MSLPPFASTPFPAQRLSALERRRAARVSPTAALPVRVSLAEVDGEAVLSARAAWDVSRNGVAIGLLDDEAGRFRLNTVVTVRLETAEGAWEVRGRVAHLNRAGLSPAWPCVLGVLIEGAGVEADGVGSLKAYVGRLLSLRGVSDPIR